jgi:hypothetical protein
VDPAIATPNFRPLGHESVPEEPNVSETADPFCQSNSPPPCIEQDGRVKELEGELKILKSQLIVALDTLNRASDCEGQLTVALDKLSRASERENYLLELVSRTSDDLLCK